nr:glycosyltransferase [bacterium]
LKVLYLIYRFPFPPSDGYKRRALSIIEALRKWTDLEVVVITEERMKAENISYFRQRRVKFRYFPLACYRLGIGFLKSLFSRLPMKVQACFTEKIAEALKPSLKKADVVLATGPHLGEYLKEAKGRKILDLLDDYGGKYQRMASFLPWYLKPIVRREGERLKKYQQELGFLVEQIWMVNPKEGKEWQKQVKAKVRYLPLAVEEKLLRAPLRVKEGFQSNVLLFVGKLSYFPNLDALRLFRDFAWPSLRREFKLLIVGSSSSAGVRKLFGADPKVKIVGFRKDLLPFFQRAFAVIVPVRIGGGVQTKVIEGMASGKPVILTEKATEAFEGAEEGRHFLVCSSVKEFPDKLFALKKDFALYRKVCQAGREYAERFFSEKQLKKKISRALD